MGITSIIIPVHNELNWTINCVEHIRKYTAKDTYEIIIVDNASTDDTQLWLSKQNYIKVIQNMTNEGFLQACNKAVKYAAGTEYLILHNDVVVASNWLESMKRKLYADERIGAVGPLCTKAIYVKNCFQYIDITINSEEEFLVAARNIAYSNKNKYKISNFLHSFCLLIKKSALDKVGTFDEKFAKGYMEDIDLSFRLIKANYTLLVDSEVLVHHEQGITLQSQGDLQKVADEAIKIMKAKWGFSPLYSLGIRIDLLSIINYKKNDLTVLEIGCACGSTLLEILNKNSKARIYGVEIDENAAEIARIILGNNIWTMNIENNKLTIEKESLDYIIMADVLEHLYDPWKIICELKEYLKPNGSFIASIPNIKHITALGNLFNADWQYLDAGILDRTHLRFFTEKEIEMMFLSYGKYSSLDVYHSDLWGNKNLVEKLKSIHVSKQNDYGVLQWIVKVYK